MNRAGSTHRDMRNFYETLVGKSEERKSWGNRCGPMWEVNNEMNVKEVGCQIQSRTFVNAVINARFP